MRVVGGGEGCGGEGVRGSVSATFSRISPDAFVSSSREPSSHDVSYDKKGRKKGEGEKEKERGEKRQREAEREDERERKR